jgi:signal transduction histidine kinase
VLTPSGPLGDAGYRIQLTDAPASGRDALVGVAQAWALAALLAVALAALAGYLLSARITGPIVALTEATDRMSEGDLAVRATVESHDEVGRLSASFNSMADSMETTVTSLRRFVADAAHEIGTPLTALHADLDLADESASTDDERRLVRRALVQAERIEELSANLLRLSRIETGESFGESERVNVSVLARAVSDASASRAEQAGISLDTRADDGPLVVMAEPAKLGAVIENLLDNALKFTPSGGSVTVTAARDGDRALLSVADTGMGIPAAEQTDVFDRFHRARNVAAYPGSGLGLAIVKATAERFGGTVSLESSEAGTRFDVRLPLA